MREDDLAGSVPICFSLDDMRAFAALSGDTNPIHSDPAVALASGFRGPIVFGGLIVARISGFIGNVAPGPGTVWTKLNIEFRGPLLVGERAELIARYTHRSESLGLSELSIDVVAGKRAIARASVTAMVRPR